MKKNTLGIYIVMIVCSVLGLFFYLNQTPPTETQESALPPPKMSVSNQTSITVAVTNRVLPAGTTLQQQDFQLRTISVLPESSEKQQFDLMGINPNHWALDSPVEQNSYIPRSVLVKPGSDAYLALTKRVGTVLFPFHITAQDEYLLFNLRSGQRVDIYLSYQRNNPEISSKRTESNFSYSPIFMQNHRLKPLLLNKRIVDIRINEGGKQLLLELQDEELKLIKGLDLGNARLQIFPSAAEQNNNKGNGLPSVESRWPVSEQPVFADLSGPPEMIGMREMRGSENGSRSH